MHSLFVKNMVCNRCVLVVQQELDKLNLHPAQVSLGEVQLDSAPEPEVLKVLAKRLQALGFELLNDRRKLEIQQVKKLIIQKVQGGEIEEHFVLSEFLRAAMQKEYGSVSRLFSEVEGTTIEQYFILQKIEKIKEWLVYGELTLSEIAWKLGYSSVAHLSSQFKKVTGLPPSHFRHLGAAHRKSIDDVQ
jgi:AraC-like DNA-binding protein